MSELTNLLIALPVAMAINIAFGIANGVIEVGFDKDKFKLGLLKALSMYMGVLGVVYVSYLIGDTAYLSDMITIIKVAVLWYTGNGIKHLAELLGQKKEGQ